MLPLRPLPRRSSLVPEGPQDPWRHYAEAQEHPKDKDGRLSRNTAPIGQQIGSGMTQAADALGITLNIINAGESRRHSKAPGARRSKLHQRRSSRLAIHDEMTAQLAQAHSMNIPVITLFTNTPHDDRHLRNADFALLGKLEADFVIAKSAVRPRLRPSMSRCLPLLRTTASMQATLKAHCPGCTLALSVQPLWHRND